MKKNRNTGGVLLLISLLIGCVLVSCSENVIENDIPQKDKETQITFSLDGLETSLSTRSPGAIDFATYSIKLFVFKRTTGDLWKGFLLDRIPIDIETSLVAVDIDNMSEYLYVFIAVPSAFKEKLVLKKGMYSPTDAAEGSDYQVCYVPVFDETTVNQNLQTGNYQVFTDQVSTGKKQDFMIYGWAKNFPSNLAADGKYTVQSVILTRQLGAIEFKAPTGKKITGCSIYSNFYRLYLTQMTDQKKIAGVIQETNTDMDITSDLVGNYPSYAANIVKTFPADSTNYRIYVPCTTLSTTVDEIPEVECANTYKGTVFWEGMGSLDPDWNDPSSPTSVIVDGIEYKTQLPFPVFPNRTTVLTINDGSSIKVTFTNAAGGGIDLDDDTWN